MKKTFRQIYAPQIAQIIADNKGKSIKELKKILQDANPGYYGHHVKTWANEYMIQLGLSRPKGGKKYHKPDANQLPLL